MENAEPETLQSLPRYTKSSQHITELIRRLRNPSCAPAPGEYVGSRLLRTLNSLIETSGASTQRLEDPQVLNVEYQPTDRDGYGRVCSLDDPLRIHKKEIRRVQSLTNDLKSYHSRADLLSISAALREYRKSHPTLPSSTHNSRYQLFRELYAGNLSLANFERRIEMADQGHEVAGTTVSTGDEVKEPSKMSKNQRRRQKQQQKREQVDNDVTKPTVPTGPAALSHRKQPISSPTQPSPRPRNSVGSSTQAPGQPRRSARLHELQRSEGSSTRSPDTGSSEAPWLNDDWRTQQHLLQSAIPNIHRWRGHSETPSDASSSRRSSSPGSRGVHSPLEPIPSIAYNKQASHEPYKMPARQPLLIVSDLNGTLIARKKGTVFEQRPGLSAFLQRLFTPTFGTSQPASSGEGDDSGHKFMIWTSARPQTTKEITEKLLTRAERENTVAVWARDKLGLTPPQYKAKVLVYKKLESIWRDTKIQESHPFYRRGERWSQRNTILIDDSAHKGAGQPYNLIKIPELTYELLAQEERDGGPSLLTHLAAYIEEASSYVDVSCFLRAHPFAEGTVWGIEEAVGIDKSMQSMSLEPEDQGEGKAEGGRVVQ